MMWTKLLFRGLDTRGAAGMHAGREEAQIPLGWTEPWMRGKAEVCETVYVREVYGEAEGEEGGRGPRAAGRREN